MNLPVVVEFLYRRIKRIVPLYYLVVAASIGEYLEYLDKHSSAAIYISPCTKLIKNMISAERAIWLTTNIHWNTGSDYFEKMLLSHDLFAHTWSLCLEMQFYLIFPLLWWLQTRLSSTKRMLFLHIISRSFLFIRILISGGVSLYFYFISESKQAFNSMFCRIWQFLFGNSSFYFKDILI